MLISIIYLITALHKSSRIHISAQVYASQVYFTLVEI